MPEMFDNDELRSMCSANLDQAVANLKRIAKRVRKYEKKVKDLADSTPKLERAQLLAKVADFKKLHVQALGATVSAKEQLLKVSKLAREEALGGRRAAKRPYLADLPKIRISLQLTLRRIEDFFKDLTIALEAARYPQQEVAQDGVVEQRWSPLLSLLAVGAERHDADFIASLRDLTWDEAQERFTKRFSGNRDPFRGCPDLLNVKQRSNESVAAFAERFDRLVEATLSSEADRGRVCTKQPTKAQIEETFGACLCEDCATHNAVPAWRGGSGGQVHLIYQFLFQGALKDQVKESLISDARFRDVMGDHRKVVELAIEQESVLATKSMFLASSAKAQQRPSSIKKGGQSTGAQVRTGDAFTAKSSTGAYGSAALAKSGKAKKESGAASQRSTNAGHGVKQRGAAPAAGSSGCTRCGRGGHVATRCRSTFDEAGLRLMGVPPGAEPGWEARPYQGCRVCGSDVHLERACKDPRARAGKARNGSEALIAVRAMQLKLANGANSAALAAESEKGKHKRSFEEAFGGDHDYGCTLCGGQHEAADCSLDGGEALL
jgi:hypothetical protein